MPTSADLGARALALGPLLLMVSSLAAAQEYPCLVEPDVRVELASGVPGVLGEVLVDRGDAVEKDQILATLDSEVEKATLELTRARAEFAGRKVQRNKELYRKQMISMNEKDELETEWELLKLELREAEERLKRRSIRSPIDGVVVERHFTTGEFVQDLPVFTLARVDPLRVEVAVPVSLHGKIRVGSAGRVTWESPSLGTFRATVTVVDAVADAASGTLGIRLELPNPDHRLPAGTKCSVRFDGGGG